MENFWPEDIGNKSGVRTPLSILQEQAAALGVRTNNVVVGEVQKLIATNKEFRNRFYILSPVLKYSFLLFSIVHNIELYPLIFNFEDELYLDIVGKLDVIHLSGPASSVSDQVEFVEVLKIVFAAKRTKKIVAAMILQSDG